MRALHRIRLRLCGAGNGVRKTGSDSKLSPEKPPPEKSGDLEKHGGGWPAVYRLADFGIAITFGFGFVSKAALRTAVNRSCRSGIQAA